MHKHISKEEVPGVQYAIRNTQKKKQVNDIKNTDMKTVRSEQSEATATHLCGLLKQGEFLAITLQEKQDATWQPYLHNLKKGSMKFILNACINTLPTHVNLKL